MPYVITEKCLGERYATCVAVCPVDCIYPGEYKGEEFMVIDPIVCIDCGACLPECPIEAIVETADTTVVVQPGTRLRVDELGNFEMSF